MSCKVGLCGPEAPDLRFARIVGRDLIRKSYNVQQLRREDPYALCSSDFELASPECVAQFTKFRITRWGRVTSDESRWWKMG
ncbi:predicted protein [Botrytis cinerea T4]|uniref:Uncharacterized protein n=1 Tax=Botryotinia fuckeliana (strain T4) TaxID=999810 RepID=G2YR98_BOTF4|nr:predicted protein [Botrytis cinerea T4]